MRTSNGVTVVISGGGKVVGVECCGGNGVAAVLELRRGNTCGGEGFGAALGRKRTRKRGIYRGRGSWRRGRIGEEDPERSGIRRRLSELGRRLGLA